MANHAYRTRTPTVQPHGLLRPAAKGTQNVSTLGGAAPPLLRSGATTEGGGQAVYPCEGMAKMTIPSSKGAQKKLDPSARDFELPKIGDLTTSRHGGAPIDSWVSAAVETPLPPPTPIPSLTPAFSRRRAIFGAVRCSDIETPDTERALASSDLALAQVRHARRTLDDALEPPIEQTFRSEGAGLSHADFADVTDLASLDRARLRHARRMASDAIDHLIALLDALDAPDEDLEPNQDGGDEDDACYLEDDGTAEPSLGAPEPHFGRHEIVLVDQTRWHMSGCDDLELGDDNGVADEDGLQEQFAGTRLIPTLAWSVGGYVA